MNERQKSVLERTAPYKIGIDIQQVRMIALQVI